MIAEAIDKILGLSGPKVIDINGRPYHEGPSGLRPVKPTAPNPLVVNSLDAMIGYLTANAEEPLTDDVFLHVEHRKVTLFGELDEDNDRNAYVVAECDVQPPQFAGFVDTEELIPSLLTGCAKTDDGQRLLEILGNVVAKTDFGKADDGFTATATVRRSVASKGTETVPNFVELAPLRTFSEIEQPTSLFNVRVKSDDKGGFYAKLSEVKDGKWRGVARKRIAEYLKAGLDRADVRIPILA